MKNAFLRMMEFLNLSMGVSIKDLHGGILERRIKKEKISFQK